MRKLIITITLATAALMTMAATVTADSLATIAADSLATVTVTAVRPAVADDSLTTVAVDSLTTAAVDSLTTVAVDSPAVGAMATTTVSPQPKHHWFKQLKRGKVDFESGKIHYPRFLRACYNTVKWYNRSLNQYDTTYVKGYGKKFKITVKNNNWLDNYDCQPFDKIRFEFNSGAASSLGAYISAFGISVGYSVDVDRLVGDRSTSKKIEIGFTCARFIIEFYHMTNKGKMTVVMHDDETKEKKRLKDYTGLRRKSWGLSANYFFNNRHYAHSAVYSCSKRQLISSGSWMAGFNITHQKFATKVEDLPKDLYDPDDLEFLEDETMFEYTDYCASGGYGYNWVLGPKWLINGTLQVYSGLKHAHSVSTSDGGGNFWSLNGKARAGVSYNHRGFFISLQGYLDTHFFNTGAYRFRSFLIDFTATTGVRF